MSLKKTFKYMKLQFRIFIRESVLTWKECPLQSSVHITSRSIKVGPGVLVELLMLHHKNKVHGSIIYSRTAFCRICKQKIILPRGGKSKQGKGKNGKKGSGKKEGYDLIVHIDLQEWKLSDDMVISPMFSFLWNVFCAGKKHRLKGIL